MLITVFEKRIDGHSENFNKELENIRNQKNQSELKKTVTEMKIHWKELKEDEVIDLVISDLKDRKKRKLPDHNNRKKDKF